MTLKAYAVKHKMSMFNVVKLVKSGKIKSETVEEDGKSIVYIYEESDPGLAGIADKKPIESREKPAGLLTRVSALENEIVQLRKEIETLKRLL